jgi:hypothetical protein
MEGSVTGMLVASPQLHRQTCAEATVMNAVENTVREWLQIVRGEFSEIPGLHLTRVQIQRLWGLDSPTCDAVLEALLNDRFLRRTKNGAYVRDDLGR